MATSEFRTSDVLRAARQSLDFARQGAEDYRAGGSRRVAGLFNFATSSRTVTFVLQNMRGHVEGFEHWYAPIAAELQANPVARWAKDLRNRVEKQGDPGPRSNVTHIHYLDTSMLTATAPPGTVSTIIGDQWGRNFWGVRLPDGTEENVYFNLDPSVGRNSILFEDAPEGRDVPELMDEHLRTLETIVSAAEARFAA
jgi:hypothetical protein